MQTAPGAARATEAAATRLAPEFAEFLTRHVRNTVREWDGREMADQIELNIGKDLQAIRVNGTIVGGVIGLGLHLLTYGRRRRLARNRLSVPLRRTGGPQRF
jgi:uncharacterized membrane-anchored protein YjiN (DUF445 family)